MSNRLGFQLPETLEMVLTERTLTIKHDGDIFLRQTLGRYIDTIAGEQNVRLEVQEVTGTILAAGDIHIDGEVDTELIYGRHVVINATNIRSRAIAATHSITLSCNSLSSDVVMAPKVILTKPPSGRVIVFECNNDCDTSTITGAYSLEQYEEKHGSATTFLEDRGLEPMESAPESFDDSIPTLTTADFMEDDQDEDTFDGENQLLAFHMEEMGGGMPTSTIDMDADDLMAEGELTEEAEPEPVAAIDLSPAAQQQLLTIMTNIVSLYQEANAPAALIELQRHVEEEDYNAVHTNLAQTWNQVLTHHSEKGNQPNRKVTHGFNLIHGMVGGA